jgi:AcrR family transcriptional regulator
MPKQLDTRERLFEIALGLFGHRGYGSVSIRELCREAGIRESSFYNHYPAKQALLDRVLAEVGAHMRSPRLLEGQRELWPGKGLEELLVGGVDLFLEAWQSVRLRQLWVVLSHEQYRNAAVAALMTDEQAHRIASTEAMFRFLMEAGRMHPGDAHQLALLYVHAISSLKLEYVRALHHGLEASGLAATLRTLAAHFARQWAR